MTRRTSRWGRFKLNAFVFEAVVYGDVGSQCVKDVMAFLSQVFIIEAKHDYSSNCIEYTGISSLFEPLEDGAIIPWYSIEITRTTEELPDGSYQHRHSVGSVTKVDGCSRCGYPAPDK